MATARPDIDARLLAAHAAGDRARLIALYGQAAGMSDDPVERAFFLTHAYVFALEAGAAEADALRARLVSLGAESPD